jgi:DnaJ-domain-containing protein 1
MKHLYGIIPVGGQVVDWSGSPVVGPSSGPDYSTTRPPDNWTKEPLSFGPIGVGDRGDEVQAIPCGDIAAVVSECPPIDYPAMPSEEIVQHLAAHQRVTERVMQRCPTLLPVKFGTQLSDADEVWRLLYIAQADLRAGLQVMAGKVEVELVVTWDPQPVFAEIALEPEITELKGAIAGRSMAEAFAESVALGERVKAALDRRKQAVRQQIRDALPLGPDGVADDMQSNPASHDRMVANLAFLLPHDRQAAFEQRLHELDARFDGRLNFRLIGPLPPYSFSTVEVQRAQAAEVAAARHRLEVGSHTDLRQIRAAYRRQARQHHPDVAQHDPEAAQRFDEITRAYELLCRCHETLRRALAPDAPEETFHCSFEAAAIEGLFLVNLRRSEQWGEP